MKNKNRLVDFSQSLFWKDPSTEFNSTNTVAYYGNVWIGRLYGFCSALVPIELVFATVYDKL